jgi:beta-mannanase
LALNLPLGYPHIEDPEKGQPVEKRPALTGDALQFGIYDPHGDFESERLISVEHIYLPWKDAELWTLTLADNYAFERGRSLLITIEPWSWSNNLETDSQRLFQDIESGRYDENISSVCSTIATLKSSISIRWAQEMESGDGPYLWAMWTPDQYISAYRHFVSGCRKHLPRATYVWSPRGDSSLKKFYPGNEYVDVIGLSVFGYQRYDEVVFGRDRTFEQVLEPRYQLVEGFGKPVIVAELGYDGDKDYLARWAKDIVTKNAKFPKLTTVVYYNDNEVFAWPYKLGYPNWRIGTQSK